MAGGLMSSGGDGGRRRRRGRVGAPMAEINVTPFVDVMLVLLIIFMAASASQMLTAGGVPLDLPESKASALPAPKAPPLVVSIDRSGAVFVGEEPTTVEALAQILAAKASAGTDERIYLRADGVVPHARVNLVMGEIYEGGFRNIAVVSQVKDEADQKQ